MTDWPHGAGPAAPAPLARPRAVAWALAASLLLALAACGETAGEQTAADAEATADAPAGEADSPAEAAEGDAEDDGEDEPKKEPTTTVDASPVTLGELVIPVIAEGTVRARHMTEIRFEITGRVDTLWIAEGQRVRKGQKIVSLDTREYELELEEARARFLQGLAQLAVEEDGYDGKKAERSLEHELDELKQLEAAGTITRPERLDRELELGMDAVRNGAYRRELREVRSGLSKARADIARLELAIEKAVLVAPFSGVVTGLTLSARERVQAGDLLAKLVDDVNIEADIGVLESDLAGIEVGRPVRLTVPALTETLDLQVDVISPEIDAASRTCSVLVRLKSEDGRIKPGMFVRAAIAGQIYPEKTLVPREAILTRDGRAMLFRVEGGRAKWVYVQLGLRNDYLVEIARVDQGGPLDDGTLVVVDNHLTLTHDAKIKVRKKLPVQDPWLSTVERQ